MGWAMNTGNEDRETAMGEIIAGKDGLIVVVRLADNRDILAVAPKRIARQWLIIPVGECVEVAFPEPPRMPSVPSTFD
jgi:hypothetical protein